MYISKIDTLIFPVFGIDHAEETEQCVTKTGTCKCKVFTSPESLVSVLSEVEEVISC